MVLTRVTSKRDKSSLTLLEHQAKVNQYVFLDLLMEKFVSWITVTFGECGNTLQHDGITPNTTAKTVQKRCRRNMAGFCEIF